MAVTLKIDDKAKAKAAKRGPKTGPEAQGFDAYTIPDEQKAGQIALGAWVGIMALLCLPWWFSEATLPFAYGMPIWCLASAGAVFLGVPAYIARQLRQSGKEAIISSQNQAPLKALMGKVSKILGIDEPEGFIESPAPPPVVKPKAAPKPKKEIDPESKLGRVQSLIGSAAESLGRDPDAKPKAESALKNLNAPSVKTQPKAVLVHRDAFKNLEPNEISALMVRALFDLRQGHARRLFLLHLVDTTQPKTTLLLVWPVLIYARLLRLLWLPHAERNTDRLAMFLVKNPNLMLAAILKDYAGRNARMQEFEISTKDVTNWIEQRGVIGGSGAEISTQYKLGRAIHEDPPLEERLQNLQNWSKSNEFTQGLEKLKSSQ